MHGDVASYRKFERVAEEKSQVRLLGLRRVGLPGGVPDVGPYLLGVGG